MRLISATLILAALAFAHVRSVGILVWHGAVVDRGEGGPSFDCFYLGSKGPVRVGYFFASGPTDTRTSPAPRADCPWVCILEKHAVRVGARDIEGWRCKPD